MYPFADIDYPDTTLKIPIKNKFKSVKFGSKLVTVIAYPHTINKPKATKYGYIFGIIGYGTTKYRNFIISLTS